MVALGVWRSLRLLGVWRLAVGFMLVRLAGNLASVADVFTFNLLQKEIL
jgi:hypothetical protein